MLKMNKIIPAGTPVSMEKPVRNHPFETEKLPSDPTGIFLVSSF
jgi:hypothetical protein